MTVTLELWHIFLIELVALACGAAGWYLRGIFTTTTASTNPVVTAVTAAV